MVTSCLSTLSLKGEREELPTREMKVYVSDELNDRFRRLAMEAFGYGRGSISKAAGVAFQEWCDKRSLSKAVSQEPPPHDERVVSRTVSVDTTVDEGVHKTDALQGS